MVWGWFFGLFIELVFGVGGCSNGWEGCVEGGVYCDVVVFGVVVVNLIVFMWGVLNGEGGVGV